MFSFNRYVNLPIIKRGKNKINETSVTKFLGIHLDKKSNFVNHITKMSMKASKSIGHLYKLNRFLPETILKTLCTSLIHPYTYHMPWYRSMAWNIKIIPLKSLFYRRKPFIRAINNLAYTMNIPYLIP